LIHKAGHELAGCNRVSKVTNEPEPFIPFKRAHEEKTPGGAADLKGG
jgi:hypothetical protein